MAFHFIDTHCHFDFPPFIGDETQSLQQAAAANVDTLIVPAVSADRFKNILDLAAQYPPVYSALGLHPIYINQHNESSLEQLYQCLAQHDKKLVAVGEIGLDLYIDTPQIDLQLKFLYEQCQLAKKFDLPVILHSRKTHDLLASQLSRYNLPCTGVIHGFSGSLEQAKRFVNLGYLIGVGGVITYPRAKKTRHVMASLPLDTLVLETDAPDMPVYGFQGQPNRPERIQQIFDVLCSLRKEGIVNISEQLYSNSQQLFFK